MMTHPGVYPAVTKPDGTKSTYFTLTDLEAVFRSLKSELGLRPYHHKPIRAEGHLFITVIAYQLVQVIPRACVKAVRLPVGRRCAASSKDSSASPPPSDAPTARHCTCARPPAPNRLNAIYMPWASTPHREGPAKPSSKFPLRTQL